jgi:hypothetical protein
MAIEIVDLPIHPLRIVIFHSYVNLYHTVCGAPWDFAVIQCDVTVISWDFMVTQ